MKIATLVVTLIATLQVSACDCGHTRFALITTFPVKWQVTTITYAIQGVPKSWQKIIAAAFAKWSIAEPSLHFTQVKSGEQITIVNDKAGLLLPQPIYVGYTHVMLGSDVRFIQHATVALNSKAYKLHVGKPYGVVWKRDVPKQPCDVDGLVLHEIGHALGLGHCPQPESGDMPTMCPAMSDQTHYLHADDINGIQSLYRVSTGDF